MLEFIYTTLSSLGFTHPLHPVATHIPMGMVIGGVIFKFASLKWETLSKTAFHCLVLGLLGAFPTIIFGIMDWQYRYLGVVNSLITAKLILAAVFTVILAITVYLEFKNSMNRNLMLLLYLLCLLPAIGLGYIGGTLIFG